MLLGLFSWERNRLLWKLSRAESWDTEVSVQAELRTSAAIATAQQLWKKRRKTDTGVPGNVFTPGDIYCTFIIIPTIQDKQYLMTSQPAVVEYLIKSEVLTSHCRVRLPMTLQHIQGGLGQDGGGQVVLQTHADGLRQGLTCFSQQLLGFIYTLHREAERANKIHS